MFNQISKNKTNNSLFLIASISVTGGIIYKIYALNRLGMASTAILTAIVFIVALFYQKNNQDKINCKTEKNKETSKRLENKDYITYLLTSSFIILLSVSFYILFKNKTEVSIISPWQTIPNYFFLIFFILTANLFVLILRKKTLNLLGNRIIFFIIPFYFLSFCVALIIYKIGFGFDSFIHDATLDLINKKGEVDPKPFYYLGYYALVLMFHKISLIPIELINKFIVPVLASIYLPLTIFQLSEKWFEDKKSYLLTTILFLSLPFSIFTLSTPQNLAFLFLLLAIILGLSCKNFFELILIFCLAISAFITQPVAGIPAILFALMITIYHSENKKIKKYYYSAIFFASSIALPAAFYVFNEKSQTDDIQGTTESIGSIIPKFYFPDLDNAILNFVYLYGFNIKLILGILSIIGVFLAWKNKEKCKIFLIYSLMFISTIVAYFLTKFNSFSFLIDYEREDYLTRILIVSTLFLTPFIFLTFYALIEKILKQSRFIKNSWLAFFVVLITSSLYYSYPRLDNYFNSHGFSVSATDIEAVQYIDKSTADDYIVLANQQVSVAALHEFGFKKYYKEDIFYYPIPTGAPLYQFYLDMVYDKPTKKTMIEAMDLAGVNKGYFVLNKYWWAFPKILEEAKLEATSYKDFNKGEVWVFEYNR